MVDLVVHHIDLTHILPLNMVFILMDVFKVGSTGWLVFNRDQNHMVRKTMVDLMVNFIELAHIRPLNMVFILMVVLKVAFTGWLFFEPRSKLSG